jgi:hypothetical protein
MRIRIQANIECGYNADPDPKNWSQWCKNKIIFFHLSYGILWKIVLRKFKFNRYLISRPMQVTSIAWK